MRLLNSNHSRVQNLTPWEIWGFIVGRVLIGFALGILVMQYYPRLAAPLAVPAMIIGIVIFAIAAKGLRRKTVTEETP